MMIKKLSMKKISKKLDKNRITPISSSSLVSKVLENENKKSADSFTLDELDGSRLQPTFHKGTYTLKESFKPLFDLFELEPTGNIFKDLNSLAKKMEDPRAFTKQIYSKIFDLYDADFSKTIDLVELRAILMDIGDATGDEKLSNISNLQVVEIMTDMAKGGEEVEKDRFIDYILDYKTKPKITDMTNILK